MPKLLFLVDELTEHRLDPLIDRYFGGMRNSVTIAEDAPTDRSAYTWIVPWNYPRLIPGVSETGNFVVFHSTALPEGRGWAPIYNTIVGQKSHYTISGIRLDEGADTGDVLIQGRFAMRPEYCASLLREWDEEICFRMLRRLFDSGSIAGRPQAGVGEVYERRTPEDNQIDAAQPLDQLIDHLRACEPAHPAFFEHAGVRYNISLTPASQPEFPADLEITVFDQR